MKIAFFSFGLLEQAGGFENFLIETTKGLADRYPNIDVDIITMSPSIVEKLQHVLTLYFGRKQPKSSIYREQKDNIIHRLGRVRYLQAQSIRDLRTIMRRYDVVYSKNEVLELGTLSIVGIKKLPPIIIGVHTPMQYVNEKSVSSRIHNILYGPLIYKKLARHITSTQVHNSSDLETLSKVYRMKNVSLIYQPFELNESTGMKKQDDCLNVLFVGRLTEAKGIDLLEEVLERIPSQGYRVKVAGSGDSVYENKIKGIAARRSDIEYMGHIDNDQIGDLYEWAHVTLITSKYETLNKVAIETASAKKIVVSVDIPGPREIVVRDVTGYLLDPDPDAFISTLDVIRSIYISDFRTLKDMGQKSFDYVKKKFDPTTSYNAIYDDLRRVVNY